MLHIHTGENRILGERLTQMIGRALAESDQMQYIIVPKQLTLLTERMLLGGLKLRGSFRLRVLSPARLCALIFDEAGMPEGVRVDDRGRVMLVRRAIHAAEGLSIYKNADRRRGFADRCAHQLELFIQAGITGDDLRACAQESQGVTRLKLNDLSAILDQYAVLMQGRYQDGDTELREAVNRASRAEFIRSGHFWFFGFDITPPLLTRLIAEIGALCPAADLLYPLDEDAGDAALPLKKALARLENACADCGAAYRRSLIPAGAAPGEIAHLARNLFACPPVPWMDAPRHVHIAMARDVRQECLLAAATARRLAMSGLRYGEIQLLCADPDGCRQLLIEAFRSYDVPLFLQSSRPVSRMATAQCLLTALSLIDKNFRSEDVFTLMRCGYMDISRDDADRLANYAVRRGIDGGRWLRPLNRGTDAEIAELEPIRARLMAPVANLKENLKIAKDLPGQLAALFDFLTEIHACERSREMQQQLIARGMREDAGLLSQSWNRIIGAMDQMAALMGEKRLSLHELTLSLTESLDAAVLKPLPQSGDAVYAQEIGRMLMQKARALIIVGLSDRGASADSDLLTPAQKQAVSEKTRAWLGPDETDAALMKRFCLQAALGMAEERVYFSCALSGADGSAQRPGMIFDLLRQLFPNLHEDSEEAQQAMLNCAPGAALNCAARALSAGRDGDAPLPSDAAAAAALRSVADRLGDAGARLKRMARQLQGENSAGVNPASARELYGKLQSQSITRLEKFAGCPFSYYVNYGLKPDRTEPFELDRRQVGSFLHEAVHEFLRVCGRDLNDMDAGHAEERMGRIADLLLSNMHTGTPMEDSASVRAEERVLRATACRCARVLCQHMQGSQFHTDQLERSFGREDGPVQLRAGDTVLEGRIDRVDTWAEGGSLRVIDFKLGGKPLNLAGAYHGLQLQLPVYLGAAMKQKRARSAGVYYFALDEGVVNTQSTDPHQVEKERQSRFRMTGLLPADEELLRAQTPNPDRVFSGRFTGDGKMFANVPCADDVNFKRLVRHAIDMAQRHLDAIRGGEAAVSPARFDGRDACTICDYRAACLFDSRLDSAKVRRLKNIKWTDVLEKIALEQGAKE